MPGIFVDQIDEDLLSVKMPYYDGYLQRIRKVDGAKWDDKEEEWVLPIESAEDLDDMFEGELIYKVPRHELLEDISPPKPPSVFKKIKEIKIKNLKHKPKDFQLFGANFLAYVLNTLGVGLLGDLMGTGKTFESIMTALQMKQAGKVYKVLVIVLAPTRLQWTQEIEKFTHEKSVLFADFKAKYRQRDGKKYVAETIDDQKKTMIDFFKHSDEMFMVMSYQTLQQNADLIEKAGFDMVIFDEAHTIKNKDSKTNKAAKKIIKPRTKRHKNGFNKGIKYTLLVTGTPVMNYPDDLFGLVGMANEKVFGKWKDFRKKYLTLNDYKDVVGYRNLDDLLGTIQKFYIRRTDKEIGLSLPPIVEEDIWIDPHPKQVKLDENLKEYQKELIKVKMDLLRSGKKSEAKAIEQQLKGVLGFRIQAGCHPNLFQMSGNEKIRNRYRSFVVKDKMEIPKFQRCIEMVQEIVDNGHKVVVFVDSRRMTVLLHQAISKFTRAVRYIGGLNDKVRDRRKYKFNNDPSCRVMIANGAGSTGLNLQAGKYLINYDLPHNPAIWNQRKYRIRRMDSKHDRVFIYNMMNRGLVDEEMYGRLQNKQASFDATMENDEATVQFHQNVVKKKRKKKRTIIKDDDIW